MALGTIGSALVGSAASAGASFLANKFLNKSSSNPVGDLSSFRPAGFSGGGLTAGVGRDGNIDVTASPERLGYVGSVADLFRNQGIELGGLRDKVAPGVSDFRAQRLAEVENARTSAIGNLRDNLARRRILGSSFGQDTLTRAENEFGMAKDKVAAESFLQELEMTNNLIQQQYSAQRSEFQTKLDELNFEAGIAAKLTGDASSQLGANARLLASLNAKEAEGRGRLFGQTFQPAFASVGKYAEAIASGKGFNA